MLSTEEIIGIKALTRIADALEKIAADGITMHHEKPEPDGREDEAVAFIKTHPSLTVNTAQATLAAMGIARGWRWVKQAKIQLGLPVGRRPVALKTDKPVNHRGLKMRESDFIADTVDESKITAAELQEREAFAIDAIKQNPDVDWAMLHSYILDHKKCGLYRLREWIDSHRSPV
jgi:hypothetical protein